MFPLQNKYKEDGLRSLSRSLYSQLPETSETQQAKTVAELRSEVRLRPTSVHISSLFLWSVIKLIAPRCLPGNVLHSPNTGRPAGGKQRPACTTSSPKRWRRYTLKRPAGCRVRCTSESAHSPPFKIMENHGFDENCRCLSGMQIKYQEGKGELRSSLHATMADSQQIKLAKAATELQSEVCGTSGTNGSGSIQPTCTNVGCRTNTSRKAGGRSAAAFFIRWQKPARRSL